MTKKIAVAVLGRKFTYLVNQADSAYRLSQRLKKHCKSQEIAGEPVDSFAMERADWYHAEFEALASAADIVLAQIRTLEKEQSD